MKIIYYEGSIDCNVAHYENGVVCYSYWTNMVFCYNEEGRRTHIFRTKK